MLKIVKKFVRTEKKAAESVHRIVAILTGPSHIFCVQGDLSLLIVFFKTVLGTELLRKVWKKIVWQCSFLRNHLNTRIELGNNNFRKQRTRISNNSYVAKTQTEMTVCVTFWPTVCLAISAKKSSIMSHAVKWLRKGCVWLNIGPHSHRSIKVHFSHFCEKVHILFNSHMPWHDCTKVRFGNILDLTRIESVKVRFVTFVRNTV